MFYKLNDGDYENNKISWCINLDTIFTIPFPCQQLWIPTELALIEGLPLPSDIEKIRLNMLMLELDEVFIHQLLIQAIFTDTTEILTQGNISLISSVPQRKDVATLCYKFVTYAGNRKTYFIIDGKLINGEKSFHYRCIEVHPSDTIIYGSAWIPVDEVTEIKWEGPSYSIEDIEGCSNLSEKEFFDIIAKIPKSNAPRNTEDSEEF